MNDAPLEESLGILARTAVELLGAPARAAFYLANDEGTALHHVVGMSEEYAKAVEGFVVGPDSLACGLAVHTGEASFTADVAQEPRWRDWLWMAEKFDYRACWSIPIHTAARRHTGTLAIYWPKRRAASAREREITQLVVQAAAIIVSRHQADKRRQRAEAALLESQQRLGAELEDAKLLQGISATIIEQNDVSQLYQRLVDAVSSLMRSDFASMQMLFPERGDGGELLLLGARGFPAETLRFWEWVRTDSNCTCGLALRTRARVVDPDIANSRLMAGTADQEALLANGMRAAQSTPLISRGGRLLGMISTHWREPHTPTERDLHLLDVIARQAADVIERRQAYEAEQAQAFRLRLLWEAATLMLTAKDPDSMLRELFVKIAAHLDIDAYFNYVADEGGASLTLASYGGISDSVAQTIGRLEMGQALCGTAAARREPIVATHIQQSQDPKTELVRSLGMRAYACNVLLVNDTLLGTLSFGSRKKDRFSADELAFLQTICQYVTAAYERLRLLRELTAADRRKDEFIATLAHELRNPLAPISNAVQILNHREPGESELRSVIERQLGHIVRLVDDLLDISRISRNRLELRKRPLELEPVVRNAIDASRAAIEQRGQRLSIRLPEQPVRLDCDEVRLSQVIGNLLNNASKYTGAGGQIWLSVERQGGEAVISVKDTGVGIAAAHLPRVFEMFYQVDQSLEKAQNGLGIGLSLVKRLVELHGGTVEARSPGAGLGSEFIVRLPVLAGEPQVDTAAAARRVDLAAPRRLLVVDDNRDAADTLVALLRTLGNEAHVAYDGQAGIERAESLKPDVVLLDLGMPGLNGYETCRRIRSQDWGKRAALIALTGLGHDRDRARSVDAGFDAHLLKPVDVATLSQMLQTQARPSAQG